ncbi:MAG TPA: efflux RND transporter periplasmic adaptor subunit [Gallionellaceae bacterium]
MSSSNKRLVFKIAAPGLALLGAGAWMLAGHSHADPAAPAVSSAGRPALTVRTTMLRPEKWSRTLEANGSIVPWQEAVIGAQVQGLRIAEVRVSIGDRVQQGEVLATLDNVVRAEGDAPHVAQGRIVAPDSGIISAANATVGSMSQPGAELFRLIRKGRLEWHADLVADELMLLKRGMTAEIMLGEGRVIKGTVRAISPSVDPKTRYGYALVSLPESDGIVAGAFARGVFDVSGGKKTLMSLPQSAVMQRGSQTFVLVVGDDKHVHERPVKIGQRNGDRVQIRGGLEPAEQVVETGGAFLTEGDVVQVIKN